MEKLREKASQSCVRHLLLSLWSLFLAGVLLFSVQTGLAFASARVSRAGTDRVSALRAEAFVLQQQLWQRATAWSSQHTYYDRYDDQTYNLGYEYQAIAYYPTQKLLSSAQTVADYQYIIGQLNGWLADFEAYRLNFGDSTSYNRVHASDLRLMRQNGEMSDAVIVISLSEQAMRIYQDGKLINAFLVVTGMPGHASLPGSWWIESKRTDTTFVSGKQPGQEGYYPPTPIAYALQYHSEGYYIHQSWWRSQFGPGKQFPHLDPHGTLFANSGSHGCINMSTADVAWLYDFAQVNKTRVLIY